MGTGFLGIVCGLKSEAQTLASFGNQVRVVVRVSGADAGRARTLSRQLVERGAHALVSFGVSGGLSPSLSPGTLVLAREVVAGTQCFSASAALIKSLQARAMVENLDVTIGRIAGSDVLLDGPDDKAALADSSSALAVDMESHAVAQVAAEARLPFVAIRAIADPFDRTLPESASDAVASDGAIRTLKVLGAALRRPADLKSLMDVGQDSAKAHKALRGCARHFVPALLGVMHIG